jgi:hypothetical protein
LQQFSSGLLGNQSVPEWHSVRFECSTILCLWELKNDKFALFQGVGEGLAAAGIGEGEGFEPVCRAAAPKLLKIAMPIPN